MFFGMFMVIMFIVLGMPWGVFMLENVLWPLYEHMFDCMEKRIEVKNRPLRLGATSTNTTSLAVPVQTYNTELM